MAARVSSPFGLIPAHAGKTSTSSSATSPRWAHPRSRGENGEGEGLDRVPEGSSPLTRGKPVARDVLGAALGLIPAHAGKTLVVHPARVRYTAHPRSRGENELRVLRPTKTMGSSPLTRGKHRRRWSRHDAGRLIPAHAGKTLRAMFGTMEKAAHPRSRGENICGT